uniref:ABC transporter ATP-binding protein n=1 Tax=Cysteiniphilum litorale TaxID=2056700 RepID=UPI003F883B4B
SIRTYLFTQICHVKYTQFIKNHVGEYTEHINNTPSACHRVLEIVILHFVSIFGALIVAIILLFGVHICFAIALLLWISVHLSIVKLINPQIAHYGDLHAQSVTKLSGQVNDVFANFLPMKWYRKEHYEIERFENNQLHEVKNAYLAQRCFEKMRLYQSMSAILYMTVMALLMLWLWSQQLISIGDLLLVPMLSFSSVGMIWWLTQELSILYRELNRIRFSLRFVNSLTAVADCKEEQKVNVKEDGKSKKIKKSKSNKVLKTGNEDNKNNKNNGNKVMKDLQAELTIGDDYTAANRSSIACVDVSFNYKDKAILKNFNLQLKKQSHLAIVGMSGSGKSTLIKLITGILQPQNGKIYLNGNDISKLESFLIGRLIAVVPQEAILFNRSIFDNIHYGRLSASPDEVFDAAKLALCDQFIECFDSQYHTIVGEGGVQLSMGQKQRIMIARAILSKAKVVILDEPTASLDVMTETLLIKTLKVALKDKIVLLISHRINALALVDSIMVLNAGEVIETGSLEQLNHSKGVFYQMFGQGQESSFSDESV